MRDKYFEPAGRQWRPVETFRRQVHWKVADLLAGVERGPWDIILWRNAAIYLQSRPAEAIWRRLVSVLAPEGMLVAGKAERPPHDAGLTARGTLRVSCSIPVRQRLRGRQDADDLGGVHCQGSRPGEIRMSFGAKIGAGFAVGLVIIVAIGVSAYVSTQRLIEANRWVTHTHQVIEGLEHVLSVLKDAETGQRGFVLTGRAAVFGAVQCGGGPGTARDRRAGRPDPR